MSDFRVIQWNIGGGKIRTPEANPTEPTSYTHDGLEEIAKYLISLAPDVITLQETHANKDCIQAQELAKRLSYDHWFNDVYADSHLEEGQGLGQAIISKHPLEDHSFTFFTNPNFTAHWDDWYDGGLVKSHDKGLTTATAIFPGAGPVVFQTLHMVPFKPFNIDPLSPEGLAVLQDVEATIIKNAGQTALLAGDFNIDDRSLEKYMPHLYKSGYEEIDNPQPTTPKASNLDHALFKGLTSVKHTVGADVLTDHYPLILELR